MTSIAAIAAERPSSFLHGSEAASDVLSSLGVTTLGDFANLVTKEAELIAF